MSATIVTRIRIRCDEMTTSIGRCGAVRELAASDIESARALARGYGWSHGDNGDRCPVHMTKEDMP